jgi:hypothetical protein
MGYRGEHFRIQCGKGGLGYNPNIDEVTPSEMQPPTRNLNLVNNGRENRGGTSHVNAGAYSGTPQIVGLYHFLMLGNDYVVACCKDGKIYRDGSNTIHPALQTTDEQYWDFEVFDDELYMVNGKNTPLKWTGSGNAAALTSIPTDWTGSNYPQWIVRHGRGASERLWYGGCPTVTPWTVYASENADGDAVSDSSVVTIKINTGDGYGITGATEFGDRLICFSKKRPYIVDDLDPTTANWGYDLAQWEGGVANFRLLCKTPNDIVCMQDDGEIYSVLSAEKYGDYRAASLTRKSYMHKWIAEYVNLQYVNKFHSVYDPYLRAIKFFIVRAGQTNVDTALVYFIDRPAEDAWMIHGNWSNTSGYSASTSCLKRKTDGEHEVYTGDYSGEIWKLEQTNKNDENNAYYSGFRSGNLHFGNTRIKKSYRRGWLTTKPAGDWNLIIDWWVDGAQQTQRTVSLAGTGAVLGSFTLGTSLLGGNDLLDVAFDLEAKGKRIQFEIYNSTINQDFFISSIGVDYKLLGKPVE